VYGKTGKFENAIEVQHQEEESNKPLIGHSPFEMGALRQQSYSTDAQAVSTQVARNPATQYLVINSKDRNQTSTTGQYVRQPWNQFRLQRPQNIMQTYATRMLVSEINFPFYVPNVNFENNQFFIEILSTSEVLTLFEVNVNIGYYGTNVSATSGNLNLAQIITAILNGTDDGVHGNYIPLLGGTGTIVNPPIVSVNVDNSFRWEATGSPFGLFSTQPNALFPNVPTNLPTEATYYNTSSLLQLMGMDYNQINGQVVAFNGGVIGNPTTLQYTQYIDIVSDKLHQYSTNRDGNTDNFFSRNLLCRLYISDESSNIVEGISIYGAGGVAPIVSSPVQFVPGVNGPFIIHRQFKNPKAVMWNKESAVDWLDISVYDQFGNLLPLPATSFGGDGYIPIANPSYPDFMITLLASEN
jgi:hypothetical protein